MIQLTCTSCKTVLSIDDAFAGGVCRCQHCGTIQTVPANKPQRPAAPVESPAATPVVVNKPPQPKALYQGSAPAPPAASAGTTTAAPAQDLTELAQAVQSSGLAGTGLHSGRLRKSPTVPAPAAGPAGGAAKQTWIIVGAIAAAVVIIALVIVLTRSGGTSATGGGAGTNAGTASGSTGNGSGSVEGTGAVQPPANPSEVVIDTKNPNCMGLPLSGPSVVYLLDCGSGTAETFDPIKGGAVKSLESLGRERKFQVVFWEVREKFAASPEASLAYANSDNIAAAMEVMRNVFADGASSIEHPLEKAIALNPADIVIISGKSTLDDEFASLVMKVRGTSPVRIHTICMGAAGSPQTLRSIAEKSGGQFRLVDGPALREYGQYTVN